MRGAALIHRLDPGTWLYAVTGLILGHREFADGDPSSRVEVQLGAVLNEPAASFELPVDLDPRPGFGCQICLVSAALLCHGRPYRSLPRTIPTLGSVSGRGPVKRVRA